MAIKMFPPGMNTLSHRSQPPSEILFFRVYDWQVTFERKAHKHCYSATLHLIYKEVTRWSLPESAFPQRPLRLCQVNHCNVSGIVLSLAANMFQKMACRGGMVPTLALQFCSSTICVVWQNPLFLSFFFFPLSWKTYFIQAQFGCNEQKSDGEILQSAKYISAKLIQWFLLSLNSELLTGTHLDFPPINLCWWLMSCSFPALNSPWRKLSKCIRGVDSWRCN